MEEVLIPLIVFSFIAFIVKMGIDYRKWKHQHATGASEDNSLGTSELKTLIREAVEEANTPLLERIEELEEHLDREPRLMPASKDDWVDEPASTETSASQRERVS